jgi:hypothetical protein
MTARTLLAGLVALAAAACGDEVDDRPATLDYITVAILRPSCGTVSCHSTGTMTEDLAFDTIEAARESIESKGLVAPGRPDLSPLVLVMRGIDLQMPPEAPLPDKDIELVERWIAAMPEPE